MKQGEKDSLDSFLGLPTFSRTRMVTNSSLLIGTQISRTSCSHIFYHSIGEARRYRP
jgi:hypothetical protein